MNFKNSKEVESSHIVPLFLKLKENLNPRPRVFNTAKFTQFGKGVGEDMKCLVERGLVFHYE